jgi:branched-chain amino acid transport system substrate-binding protein
MSKISFLIISLLLALVVVGIALAASQYDMEESVVSSGGGEHSSANYRLTDVVGEPVVGISQSSNYILRSGFLPYAPVTATQIDIPLKSGWNMVSVPVTPINNSVSAVFPDVAAVYTWDSVSKSYVTPATIEPYVGYWVAVVADTVISVTGVPISTWTTDIVAGWNMIGSLINSVDFTAPNDDPDLSVQPFAYWWDPISKSYDYETTIEPTKGYWVASIRDCSLTLQLQSYKVGALFSTTGAASNLGVPEEETVNMMVEQINAAGGINGHPLDVVFYNTESDTTRCVTLATKLIEQDNVLAIIGPTTSGESLGIIDTVTTAKVPLISCAANIGIVTPVSERYWVFKTPQADKEVGDQIMNYMQQHGITKVGIITNTSSFGAGGRTVLKSDAGNYGITIVDDQTYSTGDTSMISQLTHIKGTDAQAVICWDTDQQSAIVAQNMKTLQMNIPLYCSHGIANQAFIDEAGDAANGVIFCAGKLLVADQVPATDPQHDVLIQYKTDYETTYQGQTASTFGGYAYDALSMVVMALEKMPEGLDLAAARQAVRDVIEQTKDFAGISGVFTISPTDHLGMQPGSLAMIKIVDGKWTRLEQEALAYWWNPGTKSYTMTTNIGSGKGYWVALTQDCTLTLP